MAGTAVASVAEGSLQAWVDTITLPVRRLLEKFVPRLQQTYVFHPILTVRSFNSPCFANNILSGQRQVPLMIGKRQDSLSLPASPVAGCPPCALSASNASLFFLSLLRCEVRQFNSSRLIPARLQVLDTGTYAKWNSPSIPLVDSTVDCLRCVCNWRIAQ
jgi:hypothetical protein